MLQHTHLIVVDIHIGEDILRQNAHNIARLEKVAQSYRLLPLDDVLLVMGRATIDFSSHGLVHTGWQD